MRCVALLVLALNLATVNAFAPAARLPRGIASTTSPALPAVVAAPRPAHTLARVAACPSMALMKETPVRSATKAVGWRITAGIVTAITSYIFTGSLAMAASIVGWDLGTKSITMFIGERLWNNVEWGKDGDSGADSSQRSLAKAIAWRIFAACNTFFAAVVLSKGKAGVAGKIAGSDSVVKTVLFYFYERAWATIAWGKVESTEATSSD